MICYIFGAGEYHDPPPVPNKEDFVIGADGGLIYLQKQGIKADLVVGDFDSLGEPPKNENTLVLPIEKDDTDMAVALRLGLEHGFNIFYIYGGTGGRMDHTLANIQCLASLAHQGARGYLFGKDIVYTAINNSSISFPETASGFISVFAHSDIAQGVNEKGLKYSLSDATLHNTNPTGVSNEFVGKPSSISVKSGTLMIIYPKDINENI